MTSTLQHLLNLLPMAVKTLKYARKEVSSLSSNLGSIFDVMNLKAPPILDKVATLYRAIWVLYFCFLLPLTLFVLFYAFWASGWFGGPSTQDDLEDYPEPKGWREKCA